MYRSVSVSVLVAATALSYLGSWMPGGPETHNEVSIEDDFFRTWEHYQGDPYRIQYSALDQINNSNVRNLDVAWVYHSCGSDTANYRSHIKYYPIILYDVLSSISSHIHHYSYIPTTDAVYTRVN